MNINLEQTGEEIDRRREEIDFLRYSEPRF
jgi:hypothetical protein